MLIIAVFESIAVVRLLISIQMDVELAAASTIAAVVRGKIHPGDK